MDNVLPEGLQHLSSPKDIIGLDVAQLEQLLRAAKVEAEKIYPLEAIRANAKGLQAFYSKYRAEVLIKGTNADVSTSAQEKELTKKYVAFLNAQLVFSKDAMVKRLDDKFAADINNGLASAEANLQSAMNSAVAYQLIPQDYRNTHSISAMLGYLENGRASTWAECLDKLEQSVGTGAVASVKCPKCGSANLQITTQTDSSGGVDVGKAACGMFLLGPLGLLCGNSKKVVTHTDFWICGKCGNKFPRD